MNMTYEEFEKSARWITKEVCMPLTDKHCLAHWQLYRFIKYIIPQFLYHSELGQYTVEFEEDTVLIEMCKIYGSNLLAESLYVLNEAGVIKFSNNTMQFSAGSVLDYYIAEYCCSNSFQTCNTCKQQLSLSEYAISRNTYYGCSPKCRSCSKNPPKPYMRGLSKVVSERINEALRRPPVNDIPEYNHTDLLEKLCHNKNDAIREHQEEIAVSDSTVGRFKRAGLNPLDERLCEMCDTVYPITMFSISRKPGFTHCVCKACWKINTQQALSVDYRKGR